MTPEDVLATITVDRATFVPTEGKTKGEKLLHLRECLMSILIGTPYNTVDGYCNLWEIISSDAAYKSQHHRVFGPPTQPVVYPITPDNATSFVRSRTDTVNKFLWHDFKLHKSAKCGCCAFIINAVEDTRIRELRYYKTIYANITTKALMYHIQLRYDCLHALEVVNLTSDILTYYGDASGIPEYINMLEDTQKKAQQAQIPIPDVTIMAIDTKLLLQAQYFTPKTK